MIENIPVVYEDDALVIVNKPPGLLTVGGPDADTRHLTLILNEEAAREGASYRLHPCHRLDKETSGLVIYAKGKAVQQQMMELFKQHLVQKVYRAFAHGRIAQDQGTIRKAIEGKHSVTHFKVVKRLSEFTVLDVRPETGRKNQIRLHFKSLGHPLVGESKFIFRKDFSLRAKRLCLHAGSISFPHPISKKNIKVECPLARDMEKFALEHA
jgi:23S rRNA pseudouridine1911/1915/1917 synthase